MTIPKALTIAGSDSGGDSRSDSGAYPTGPANGAALGRPESSRPERSAREYIHPLRDAIGTSSLAASGCPRPWTLARAHQATP